METLEELRTQLEATQAQVEQLLKEQDDIHARMSRATADSLVGRFFRDDSFEENVEYIRAASLGNDGQVNIEAFSRSQDGFVFRTSSMDAAYLLSGPDAWPNVTEITADEFWAKAREIMPMIRLTGYEEATK